MADYDNILYDGGDDEETVIINLLLWLH